MQSEVKFQMEPTSLPGILKVEDKLRLRHGVF